MRRDRSWSSFFIQLGVVLMLGGFFFADMLGALWIWVSVAGVAIAALATVAVFLQLLEL